MTTGIISWIIITLDRVIVTRNIHFVQCPTLPKQTASSSAWMRFGCEKSDSFQNEIRNRSFHVAIFYRNYISVKMLYHDKQPYLDLKWYILKYGIVVILHCPTHTHTHTHTHGQFMELHTFSTTLLNSSGSSAYTWWEASSISCTVGQKRQQR